MNCVVRPTTKHDNSVMTVDELVRIFYDRFWNRIELSVADEILHLDVVFRGSVGVGVTGVVPGVGEIRVDPGDAKP